MKSCKFLTEVEILFNSQKFWSILYFYWKLKFWLKIEFSFFLLPVATWELTTFYCNNKSPSLYIRYEINDPEGNHLTIIGHIICRIKSDQCLTNFFLFLKKVQNICYNMNFNKSFKICWKNQFFFKYISFAKK